MPLIGCKSLFHSMNVGYAFHWKWWCLMLCLLPAFREIRACLSSTSIPYHSIPIHHIVITILVHVPTQSYCTVEVICWQLNCDVSIECWAPRPSSKFHKCSRFEFELEKLFENIHFDWIYATIFVFIVHIKPLKAYWSQLTKKVFPFGLCSILVPFCGSRLLKYLISGEEYLPHMLMESTSSPSLTVIPQLQETRAHFWVRTWIWKEELSDYDSILNGKTLDVWYFTSFFNVFVF